MFRKKGLLTMILICIISLNLLGEVAATHIYHNHMPNFWPAYDLSSYDSTADGSEIRYTYDGQVVNMQQSPADWWTMLPDGTAAPHDAISTGSGYYPHDAKKGAYLSWPMSTVNENNGNHPLSQAHVTMSAAVINNVNSFAQLDNLDGYENDNWGQAWRDTYSSKTTTNGYKALDMIHFTGHHSMGPITGPEYFLKDLIYHNVTVAQDYFLGDTFTSSKGYFPTELGFSERLIPVLEKIGVEWSVLPNTALSRSLKDYPYLNEPGKDCLITPPNRADMQNTDTYNSTWVQRQKFNEPHTTYNKFPFASLAHWVQYVNPETGAVSKIAGVPVEQAGSWEEGYQGSATAGFLKEFEGNTSREQYFVIAHDGDNSAGRAGSYDTWMNSGRVTYSEGGVTGMGVDEYLRANPIPSNDIQHVQDGSWIDPGDSSSDPTFYHWRVPFGVWNTQLSDFNNINDTDYTMTTDKNGAPASHMVSFEMGYNTDEKNAAILQAGLNYAQTAEQIWLDDHPNHWMPISNKDLAMVGPNNTDNQLNPYMYSYPTKGQANYAELSWYFLMAAYDSGFFYYGQNVDDGLKPILAINQSLHFAKRLVDQNLEKDATGPSMWWVQRWPYNPGSANCSKAEGWGKFYYDNNFGIYTYAYDVNEISDMKIKIRTHNAKTMLPTDIDPRIYSPASNSQVNDWVSYDMNKRDLEADKNGVDWQAGVKLMQSALPATEIGDLYYGYLSEYRDQLIDYYIEGTDSLGNVTKSEIQHLYVGAGRYSTVDGVYVEDINGEEGQYPFFSDKPQKKTVDLYVESTDTASVYVQYKSFEDTVFGNSELMTTVDQAPRYKNKKLVFYSDEDYVDVKYSENQNTWLPSSTGFRINKGTWTIKADGSLVEGAPADITYLVKIYYKGTGSHAHWSPVPNADEEEAWTVAPGQAMAVSSEAGYLETTLNLGLHTEAFVCFNANGSSWDPDGGRYTVSAGNWIYENGSFTEANFSSAPVITASPAGGLFYNNVNVSLNITEDSNLMSYKIDNGSWVNLGSSNETVLLDMSGLVNGATRVLTVSATNDDGTTEESYTFTKEFPSLAVVSSNPAGGSFTESNVAVTVSASGEVDNAQYKIGNGNFVSFVDSASFNLDMSGVLENETVSVIVEATNVRGTSSQTYTFTKLYPSLPTVSASPAGGEFTEDSVSVTVTASGVVDSAKYKIGNANFISFTGSANTAIDLSGVGVGGIVALTVEATNIKGTSSQTYNFTKTEQNGMKIYFKNNNNWSTVNIYAYTESSIVTLHAGTWPGKTMVSEGDNWYSYELMGIESAQIIFNDGGSNQIPNGAGTLRTSDGWYDNAWYDTDPRVAAPVISALPAGGEFTASSVAVSLTVGNNPTSVQYSYNNSSWTTLSSPYSLTVDLNIADDTSKILYVKATNNEGTDSKQYTFTKKGEQADTWYFRGTANSWAATEMTYNSATGKYETTQSFADGDGGGGARFKICHDTNWGENYPVGDYTVNANTTYLVEFDANSKTITVTGEETPDTWYFRGTANNWGSTELTYNSSTGNYDLSQAFANGDSNGGPRFKICHDTYWGETYPEQDVTVTGNATYMIIFNPNTKEITVQQ